MAQSASQPNRSVSELASCVSILANLLQTHFRCETETYEVLKAELGCVEVDTAKRQAEADQAHLLKRLAHVSDQLSSPQSDFALQASLIERLDWLFDDLDQHQERECESIEWLSQNGCA